MQNDDFTETYRKNVFKFGDAIFTIESPMPSFQAPWAIITAWNPGNNELTKPENDQRNESLKKFLSERGYCPIDCVGGLDKHAEDSFLIQGMNHDEAMEIGRQCGQFAIVHNDGKKCGYYNCFENTTIIEIEIVENCVICHSPYGFETPF